MLTDPSFWLLAIPGVLIAGFAKGGFSGGAAFVATPMIALSVGPANAAAIMLPVLVMMDMFAVRAYWGQWSWPDARILMIGAVPGIVLGWLLFRSVDEHLVKLALGAMAIGFVAFMMARKRGWIAVRQSESMNAPLAAFWGAGAGFTSFVAHAGGPPSAMHLLSRPLSKTEYQATSVAVFTAVNLGKAPFYAALGLFGGGNLTASLMLFPVAVIGILTGIWAHRRISERAFFGFIYTCLVVIGVKLVWEGLTPVH